MWARAGHCRLRDDYTIFGGFMRDLTQWVSVKCGGGRRPNQPPTANGILGTVLQSIVARRAKHDLLAARNDAARPVDAEGAQRLDCELASALPPFERARLIGSVVRDITRQNWPLRQAQLQVEELASANRRKDEFLAMLSHELRSPLAAIHYAVRCLGKQAGEEPTQKRMRALIERQLGRMSKLVDELLDVSRITNGRVNLLLERIDLRVIVNNAIETLQSDIDERNHRLTIELPDAPVWLQGDPARLEQVFVNLLANASRYTDAGGELTAWVHTKQAEAVVRVRDSGIGIAPGALPHIFDLFKQGNEGEPRSRAGLGVGLAVARNLVELHGGSVTAASGGTGHGSEFTVRLPTSD